MNKNRRLFFVRARSFYGVANWNVREKAASASDPFTLRVEWKKLPFLWYTFGRTGKINYIFGFLYIFLCEPSCVCFQNTCESLAAASLPLVLHPRLILSFHFIGRSALYHVIFTNVANTNKSPSFGPFHRDAIFTPTKNYYRNKICARSMQWVWASGTNVQ